MIDIVTNNVKQIGTPADEGRVYISEKAYKRIKTEGFKDKEVFVLMGHTESSGGRYATFVEAAIAVYDMEFDKNAPLWTNKVWSRVFAVSYTHLDVYKRQVDVVLNHGCQVCAFMILISCLVCQHC